MGIKKKIFSLIYPDVHIIIILTDTTCIITVNRYKSKKLSSLGSKEFALKDNKLSDEAINYINLQKLSSPFTYLSTLNNSLKQGAIDLELEDFFSGISHNNAYAILKNKRFIAYDDKNQIQKLKKKFKKCKLDLIISPFFIIENVFKKEVKGGLALYILIEKIKISICIFKENKLLYAKYTTTSEEEIDDMYDDDLSKDMDYDSVNEEFKVGANEEKKKKQAKVEEIKEVQEENLEEEKELKDLDELNDLDDEIYEMSDDIQGTKINPNLLDFKGDYKRFEIIKSSINEFYENTHFKSDFIENLYIADSQDIKEDLTKLLEDELCLNIKKVDINLTDEILKLSLKEVKHAL